jgi:hypothetical protein
MKIKSGGSTVGHSLYGHSRFSGKSQADVSRSNSKPSAHSCSMPTPLKQSCKRIFNQTLLTKRWCHTYYEFGARSGHTFQVHPIRWTIDARYVLLKVAQLLGLVEEETLLTQPGYTVAIHTKEKATTRAGIVDKRARQTFTGTGFFVLAAHPHGVNAQKYKKSLPHIDIEIWRLLVQSRNAQYNLQLVIYNLIGIFFKFIYYQDQR